MVWGSPKWAGRVLSPASRLVQPRAFELVTQQNAPLSRQPLRNHSSKLDIKDLKTTSQEKSAGGATVSYKKRRAYKMRELMFSRNDPFFSLGTGSILILTKSKYQFGARVLNKALVKYFGEDWSGSYESVDVPYTLSAYREEVKVTFGKELRHSKRTGE